MAVTIIPFRTVQFSVPTPFLMQVFRIIVDNELVSFVENISEDNQFLILAIRVNLSKTYQRNALAQIEQLVLDAGIAKS